MSMSLTPAAPERSREQSRPQAAPALRSAATLGIDLGRVGRSLEQAGPQQAGPRVQRLARSLEKALERHAGTLDRHRRISGEIGPMRDQQQRGVLNQTGLKRLTALLDQRRENTRQSGDAALSIAMTSRRLARAMGREPDPPSPAMRRQIGGVLQQRLMDAMRTPQVGKIGRVMAVASALGVSADDMRAGLSPKDAARFDGMRAATALALTAKHGRNAAAALGFRDPREAVLLHKTLSERTPGGLGVALGKSERDIIKSTAEGLTNDYRRHKELSAKMGGLAANDPRRAKLQTQIDGVSRRVMHGVNSLTMWAHAGRRDEVLGVIAQSQGGRKLAQAVDKRAGQMLDRARVDQEARSLPMPGPTGMAFKGRDVDVSSALRYANLANALGKARESNLERLGQGRPLSQRDERVLGNDADRLSRMGDHATRMGRIFFNQFGQDRQAAMAAFGRAYPEAAKVLGITVDQDSPSAAPRSAQMARSASRPWEQSSQRIKGLMSDPHGRQALQHHLDRKAEMIGGLLDQHRAMGMVLGTESVRKSLALGNATAAAMRDRMSATAEMLRSVLGPKTLTVVERRPEPGQGYGPAPRPRWA